MTETDTQLRPILVVDDDPYMRTSLMDCLVSCGYAVETAIDGADALGKFRRGVYEMVITDIRMPKMGGLDLLKAVKGQAPETPVIVITAYDSDTARETASRLRVNAYLRKPVDAEVLLDAVRRAVGPREVAPPAGAPGREGSLQ